MIKKYSNELLSAMSCVVLGMLSGWVAFDKDMSWYKALMKPSFNPPSWVFSPVWTLLYVMMGVAFGKIIRLQQNTALVALFVLQFLCNISWSYLFFGMHRIDLAMYDCVILWILLFVLLVRVFSHKQIFVLLFPYFLWTTFALILNVRLYMLNVYDLGL